jgi:hypothetical protein
MTASFLQSFPVFQRNCKHGTYGAAALAHAAFPA